MRGSGRALRRARAGYSLMEVLIVVAILGVAATLSAPSISRMIAGQQARQVVRSLVTEFGAIRADAFIQSQSFDADAISSRLSEHAPDGWRVSAARTMAFFRRVLHNTTTQWQNRYNHSLL